MPNGNNKNIQQPPTTVHVSLGKVAVYQTPEGWFPAMLAILQREDGSPYVVNNTGNDTEIILLRVAQGLRQAELAKEKDPRAALRSKGFVLP